MRYENLVSISSFVQLNMFSIQSYIYCIKIMLINQFRHFVKFLPFFPGILQNALKF